MDITVEETIAWFVDAIEQGEGIGWGYQRSFIEQCIKNGGHPPVGDEQLKDAREALADIKQGKMPERGCSFGST